MARKAPPKDASNKNPNAGKENGPSKNHNNERIAEALTSIEHTLIKQGDANRAQEEREDTGNKWIAGLTLFFVILTTIGIFIQALILHSSDVTFQNTLQNQRDSNERQLRAYVGIESKGSDVRCTSCDPNPALREKIAKALYDDDFLAFGIRNSGQTPAHDLSARSSWKEMAFGAELPKDFDYLDTPLDDPALPMSKSTVNPGESVVAGNQFGPEIVAMIIRAKNHQSSIYVYGHIDYRDVFRKNRTTPFCFRYAPDVDGAHRLPLCPEHNSPSKDD